MGIDVYESSLPSVIVLDPFNYNKQSTYKWLKKYTNSSRSKKSYHLLLNIKRTQFILRALKKILLYNLKEWVHSMLHFVLGIYYCINCNNYTSK